MQQLAHYNNMLCYNAIPCYAMLGWGSLQKVSPIECNAKSVLF